MAITASITSPADVVNNALGRIGHTWRVGNLYDGSKGAKLALDMYGQTRDDLLMAEDWEFAQRDAVLTLLKVAPQNGYVPPTVWNPATNPPVPWFFEYQYPSDGLKVRAIKNAPLMVPNFDPKPILFEESNDNALNPPQKVILCNIQGAICVYTGRVTDPTTWTAGFSEELVAAMARRLAPAIAGLDAAKLEAQDEAQAMVTAEGERG